MLLSSLVTVALAQGAPFRGMVQDANILIQKDPLNVTRSFPIAGGEGRNFVVALSGRSTPKLEVFEIGASNEAKSLGTFQPDAVSLTEFSVHPGPKGGFWAAAHAVPKSQIPYSSVTLFDSTGKRLMQSKFGDKRGHGAAISDKDGNLYLVDNAGYREIVVTKIGTDGKEAWTKKIIDSEKIRFRSMTFTGPGDLILFGEKPGPENRISSIFMASVSPSDGNHQSGPTLASRYRGLGHVSVAWNTIAYTTAVLTDGTTEFLVCSTKSLSPTAKLSLGTEGVRGNAMLAHPTRGIYVAVNNQVKREYDSKVFRISYGGKVYNSFPAIFNVPKVETTALVMDRHQDVYAAGRIDGGSFVSKFDRPDGTVYRQINMGEGSPGRGSMSVNNDTGEVILALAGRVTKYSQSPLLYSKTMDLIEDQSLKDRNCLENDRYTMNGTIVLVTGPTKGKLTLKPTGDFTYTPAPGYVGMDGFTYRVNRGNVSSYSGEVKLKIAASPKNSG